MGGEPQVTSVTTIFNYILKCTSENHIKPIKMQIVSWEISAQGSITLYCETHRTWPLASKPVVIFLKLPPYVPMQLQKLRDYVILEFSTRRIINMLRFLVSHSEDVAVLKRVSQCTRKVWEHIRLCIVVTHCTCDNEN